MSITVASIGAVPIAVPTRGGVGRKLHAVGLAHGGTGGRHRHDLRAGQGLSIVTKLLRRGLTGLHRLVLGVRCEYRWDHANDQSQQQKEREHTGPYFTIHVIAPFEIDMIKDPCILYTEALCSI
jgi:hypothetical protein